MRDAEGLELCPLLPVSSLVLQAPGPSAGPTFPVTSCCVHQTGVPVVLPPSTDGASGCSVPLATALKASWNGALSQLMCSVGLVFPKLVSGCSLHLLEIPELSGILCVCVCACVHACALFSFLNKHVFQHPCGREGDRRAFPPCWPAQVPPCRKQAHSVFTPPTCLQGLVGETPSLGIAVMLEFLNILYNVVLSCKGHLLDTFLCLTG